MAWQGISRLLCPQLAELQGHFHLLSAMRAGEALALGTRRDF
jgi:hypothetical protein